MKGIEDGSSLWSEHETYIIQHWTAGISQWTKPLGFMGDYPMDEALEYARGLIET